MKIMAVTCNKKMIINSCFDLKIIFIKYFVPIKNLNCLKYD